jgi:hypothetical protein
VTVSPIPFYGRIKYIHKLGLQISHLQGTIVKNLFTWFVLQCKVFDLPKKVTFWKNMDFGGLQELDDNFFDRLLWSLFSKMFHFWWVFNKWLCNLICHLASIWTQFHYLTVVCLTSLSVSLKHNVKLIMDKTPTPALFTQHYISLACWFH